jgi:hypothetical protein
LPGVKHILMGWNQNCRPARFLLLHNLHLSWVFYNHSHVKSCSHIESCLGHDTWSSLWFSIVVFENQNHYLVFKRIVLIICHLNSPMQCQYFRW